MNLCSIPAGGAQGEGGVSAVQTRFSARLRVDVRGSDWAATGQSKPWRTAIRLLRRPTSDAEWVSEFSDSGELTADSPFLREVQTAGNGEYALEVTGTDPPVRPPDGVLRDAGHRVDPSARDQAGRGSARVAESRVRQWPFEYLVTLYQEAADGSQSQALAFQFQLPGPDGRLDGGRQRRRSRRRRLRSGCFWSRGPGSCRRCRG